MKRKHACKCVLNTTRYLACSLVVNYMHDAMNKILELFIKLKSSTTHK
jgi:hypothetical protein